LLHLLETFIRNLIEDARYRKPQDKIEYLVVIAAVVEYFADLTKNHYRDGIMALEHR
jgi:hypothetical protein